jgi:RHS repeat-associated protein
MPTFPVKQIWTQQAGSGTAVVNTLGYDQADQLTGNVQSGGATTTYGYGYDPAGNRLTGKVNSTTTAGQFNNLNQLVAQTSSATSTTVKGHTSAAVSSVSIDAVPATISSVTNFTANVKMPSGTNVISVVAEPSATGSSPATQLYKIVATGSAPTSLSYDANGNVTTDESGNSYQWDALNRLTQITYPSAAYTTFAYDGLGRRVQIAESTSSIPKNYLWIGSEIAEERSAGNTATKRFFPQGEQQSGTNYYYTRDHLGSVREMLNSSGSIVARYGYDPYGKTTLVSGSNLSTKQYAGMYMHQPSALYLTRAGDGSSTGRPFDPATGRWLSRDPINEDGGMNLYGYCSNDPADYTDTSGLFSPAPSPVPVIPDPVPLPPVPPEIPPVPVFLPAALVIIDAAAIIYDVDQISQIIESERELQQMQAALAAQQAYAQAQRGKSNQADTGIMAEAAACGVAKKQADLCKWLQDQMKKARQNRDFERFNKLKGTYKDKCRGWRG